MFCNNCGKEIDNMAVVCPSCGCATSNMQNAQKPAEDKGGFGWGLLGCCVPIAGLVLYLLWKNEKPKTAKAVGVGAIVSVCLAVVYYIVVIMIAMLAGGMS